jgi:hypothetical protein
MSCAPAHPPQYPTTLQMTGVTLILESEEERDTAVQLAIYNMAPAGAKPAQLDRCAVLCGRPAGLRAVGCVGSPQLHSNAVAYCRQQ